MPTRKQINKGFYGFQTDDAEFLTPDGAAGTNPWVADAHSTVGYNASKDDSAGTHDLAGYGIDGADDLADFLAPSWVGDSDGVHGKLNVLIDNDPSMPNPAVIGGGGPLDGPDVGAAPPRFRPKDTGPVTTIAKAGVVANAGP